MCTPGCNPTRSRLQPNAIQAAAPRNPSCSPPQSMLQPQVDNGRLDGMGFAPFAEIEGDGMSASPASSKPRQGECRGRPAALSGARSPAAPASCRTAAARQPRPPSDGPAGCGVSPQHALRRTARSLRSPRGAAVPPAALAWAQAPAPSSPRTHHTQVVKEIYNCGEKPNQGSVRVAIVEVSKNQGHPAHSA